MRQLDDFNDFAGSAGGSGNGGGGGAQGDFLARERELLGDEFGPTPAGLPSSSDFDSSGSASRFPELDIAPTAAAAASRPSSDFVSSFERDPPKKSKPQQASVAFDDDEDDEDHQLPAGGNDEVQQFQSNYPDLDLYPAQQAAPQQQQQQQVRPSLSSFPLSLTSQSCQNGYSSEGAYSQPAYTSAPTPAEPESDAIR